ncbi:unnamed protein product [Brachionus calyciflorus]|uniref:VCBS repeat-containing protein n=1 Tax=Brachionus calyciflorus TaxID=104777 RepID=A0A814M1W7_9BILA|nr:unnamed protein product [Brachionus calyciflorus]
MKQLNFDMAKIDYFEKESVWLTVGFSSLDFTKSISRVVDLNGDGLADVALLGQDGLYVSINSVYFFMDVNADYLADMVAFQSDGVFVGINTGSSFKQKVKWSNLYYDRPHTYLNRYLIDMNLDGLVDLVGTIGANVYISLNNGTSFNTQSSYGGYSYGDIRVIDINNDYLPDLVRVYSKTIYVRFNNGSGLENEILYGKVDYYPVNSISNLYFLDVNRDDYIDSVWMNTNTNKILASINNKQAFESSINVIQSLPTDIKYDLKDFEYTDLYSNESLSFLSFSQCNAFVTTDTRKKLSFSSITNSFGDVTHITYERLSNSSIYKSTKLLSYPYTSKFFTKSVVASLEIPSGIKTSNVTYSKYEDYVIDH